MQYYRVKIKYHDEKISRSLSSDGKAVRKLIYAIMFKTQQDAQLAADDLNENNNDLIATAVKW